MIRRLLAATAITIFAATGIAAADNSEKTRGTTATQGDATGPDDPMASAEGKANSPFKVASRQILASILIGKAVYNGEGDNAEIIGGVNDVVISKAGIAEAVVVDVGGFLGIGNKDVAIDLAIFRWVQQSGTNRLTLDTTEQALRDAPVFDRLSLISHIEPKLAKARSEAAAPQTPSKPEVASGTAALNEHAGLTSVEPSTLSAEKLIGAQVVGADEKALGEISDVIVSADGLVEAYIVDVGGFLGIGEKPMAFDVRALGIFEDADGKLSVYTRQTEKHLRDFPAYSETAYEEDPEAVLIR